VFNFLVTPRTWIDLESEADRLQMPQDFLRNVLAWLEDRKLAASWKEKGVIRWGRVTDAVYPL
jgi:hypothetical protein